MASKGFVPLRLRMWWALCGRSPHSFAVWIILLLSITAIAATTRTVVDLMRWRDAGAAARTVAADRTAPIEERVDAIVVMQRDSLTTMELLRQLSSEDGKLGHNARHAKATLRDAASK